MKKIITTVGTSIFTNLYADEEIKRLINNLEGKEYVQYNEYIEDIEGKQGISQSKGLKTLVWEKIKDNERASAEINSTLKILNTLNIDTAEIYLIATDTILSVLACELIQKWFLENHTKKELTVIFQRSAQIISKLRVDSKVNYEDGFMNLINHLNEIISNSNTEYVLNITGGYKALIPVLTLYGQIKEIPLYYLYNDSTDSTEHELVSIGSLPFQFDAVFAERYYLYLQNTGLLNDTENKNIRKELKNHKLIRFEKPKNYYSLTPLGSLYKSYIDQQLAESKQVFGFLVEYKIFEKLLEEHYLCHDGTILKEIKRSKKDTDFCVSLENRSIEIDLVMSDANTNTIAIGEVKSYLSIAIDDNFEKLKKQVFRQIDGLKKQIKEYVLYVYMDNIGKSVFYVMDKHKEKLIKIEKIVKARFKECVFRVFLISVTHKSANNNNDNRNVYLNFIQHPLYIHEYNLNKS